MFRQFRQRLRFWRDVLDFAVTAGISPVMAYRIFKALRQEFAQAMAESIDAAILFGTDMDPAERTRRYEALKAQGETYWPGKSR